MARMLLIDDVCRLRWRGIAVEIQNLSQGKAMVLSLAQSLAEVRMQATGTALLLGEVFQGDYPLTARRPSRDSQLARLALALLAYSAGRSRDRLRMAEMLHFFMDGLAYPTEAERHIYAIARVATSPLGEG